MKKVTCFFDRPAGRLNPQHGFVGYPEGLTVHYGTTDEVDSNHLTGSADAAEADYVDQLFREIGCPVIRLKDRKSRGYGKKIEIPYVFRDFDKDPADSANWYWYVTDPFIKGMEEWAPGRKMIRLGAPRETWAPIFNGKPKDYEKWADLCVRYIRHVNGDGEGELNANVGYWEIWERADDPLHWSGGTAEDYYELYGAAARAIRATFPDLKVGGPAAAMTGGDTAFLQGFLAYVKENDLPCDFVSWNYYGEDPEEAIRLAERVRELVREADLPGEVEITNDAWNCMTIDGRGFFAVPHVNDMQGAAFGAAFMIGMQLTGMDFSAYYECDKSLPWTGLVHPWFIEPNKPLFSFVAFSRLYKLGTEAAAEVEGDGVYALAAAKDGADGVMISLFNGEPDEITVEFGSRKKRKVYLLDDWHDLMEMYETEEESTVIRTEGYTVLLIMSAE